MAAPSVQVGTRPVSIWWFCSLLAWLCGVVISVLGMLGAVASWSRADMTFATLLCLFTGLILGSLS
jgi:hypothetical protein